jgi:hypothetical protein
MGLTKELFLRETGGFPPKLLLRTTRPLPRPNQLPQGWERAVFLDVETEPVVWGITPKPLLACICDLRGREWRTFRARQFQDLRQRLRRAPAVVTFNGDRFDFKVIAKHLGLSIRKLRVRSFDLMREIKRACGWSHNLNNLAYANLGEPKRCMGAGGRRSAVRVARDCRSDVDQLRRLFLRYVEGTLVVPVFGRWLTNAVYRRMPFGGQCPACHDVGSICEPPSEEAEKESEAALLAQVLGDPEACAVMVGLIRSCRCFTCGAVFSTDGETDHAVLPRGRRLGP